MPVAGGEWTGGTHGERRGERREAWPGARGVASARVQRARGTTKAEAGRPFKKQRRQGVTYHRVNAGSGGNDDGDREWRGGESRRREKEEARGESERDEEEWDERWLPAPWRRRQLLSVDGEELEVDVGSEGSGRDCGWLNPAFAGLSQTRALATARCSLSSPTPPLLLVLPPPLAHAALNAVWRLLSHPASPSLDTNQPRPLLAASRGPPRTSPSSSRARRSSTLARARADATTACDPRRLRASSAGTRRLSLARMEPREPKKPRRSDAPPTVGLSKAKGFTNRQHKARESDKVHNVGPPQRKKPRPTPAYVGAPGHVGASGTTAPNAGPSTGPSADPTSPTASDATHTRAASPTRPRQDDGTAPPPPQPSPQPVPPRDSASPPPQPPGRVHREWQKRRAAAAAAAAASNGAARAGDGPAPPNSATASNGSAPTTEAPAHDAGTTAEATTAAAPSTSARAAPTNTETGAASTSAPAEDTTAAALSTSACATPSNTGAGAASSNSGVPASAGSPTAAAAEGDASAMSSTGAAAHSATATAATEGRTPAVSSTATAAEGDAAENSTTGTAAANGGAADGPAPAGSTHANGEATQTAGGSAEPVTRKAGETDKRWLHHRGSRNKPKAGIIAGLHKVRIALAAEAGKNKPCKKDKPDKGEVKCAVAAAISNLPAEVVKWTSNAHPGNVVCAGARCPHPSRFLGGAPIVIRHQASTNIGGHVSSHDTYYHWKCTTREQRSRFKDPATLSVSNQLPGKIQAMIQEDIAKAAPRKDPKPQTTDNIRHQKRTEKRRRREKLHREAKQAKKLERLRRKAEAKGKQRAMDTESDLSPEPEEGVDELEEDSADDGMDIDQTGVPGPSGSADDDADPENLVSLGDEADEE
ncbi:hypothetical protein B0H21DRAFT_828202 [Amylocystis lapponica]|nr:hypothetical protein B0H21DRAFT_828202 [Amylocystis lapponica]